MWWGMRGGDLTISVHEEEEEVIEELSRFSIPRDEDFDGLENLHLTDDPSRTIYLPPPDGDDLPGVDLPDSSPPIPPSPHLSSEEEGKNNPQTRSMTRVAEEASDPNHFHKKIAQDPPILPSPIASTFLVEVSPLLRRPNTIVCLQDTRNPSLFLPGYRNISITSRCSTVRNHPTAAGGLTTILTGPLARFPRQSFFDSSGLNSFLGVKVNTSPPLLIINTYLPSLTSSTKARTHPANYSSRAFSRKKKEARCTILSSILRLIKQNSDTIILVCGDMNRALPRDSRFKKEDPTWKKIREAGMANARTSLDPHSRLPPSYRSGERSSMLDNIFFSPSSSFIPTSPNHLTDFEESDHVPVTLSFSSSLLIFSPKRKIPPPVGPDLSNPQKMKEFEALILK